MMENSPLHHKNPNPNAMLSSLFPPPPLASPPQTLTLIPTLSSPSRFQCRLRKLRLQCLRLSRKALSSDAVEHLVEVQNEEASLFVPVKAFFLCTAVDLKGLRAKNVSNVVTPTFRITKYVVLRFPDPENVGIGGPGRDSLDECNFCHMVVFHYGSIVLFNVSDNEVNESLRIVEEHASPILSEVRKDEYAVVVKPALETWMQGGLDHVMLKTLTIDGVRTIASVLGQSIALEYYIRRVDGMVAEFTDINRDMEKTGTFTMQRKKLFQLVGKANSSLADIILKVGLFERSDIAWKNANYAQLLEYLRDEFELTAVR